MPYYHINLENESLGNNFFRKVLFTGKNMQLVLMNLKPQEEVGMEVHEHVDQFFRVETGQGKAVVDGEEFIISDGSGFVVVAGSMHNVINTSTHEDLKLYTIYSPANHPDGTIHKTKTDAEKSERKEHH